LARAFRAIFEKRSPEKCLRHNRSRLPLRRRGRDNWEPVATRLSIYEWALRKLRGSSPIVGAILRRVFKTKIRGVLKQRFAAEFDHPKIRLPDEGKHSRNQFSGL